jgi:hypothetical protein
MIFEALSFLVSELNAYLNQKMFVSNDARVRLGNVARALDGTLTQADALEEKVVVTVVNLEEERTVRRQETLIKTATSARYKNPPLLLNLYVLVSIYKDSYADCLVLLGHIVQFFQFQNNFTPLSHPSLDPRIEKLTVELYTMNFEQVNHLWSTLGGKYFPSVLYKVRQLTVDENAVVSESGLIREIQIDERTVQPRS